MAPPASFRTTIRRLGFGFGGAEEEAAGVVQEGHVSQEEGGFLAAAEAMPVAVAMVPSIPAKPRLAKRGLRIWQGAPGQVHVADAV